MDKYQIPDIRVGNKAKPGLAYGGIIYGMSANINSNADTSTMNLNIALDTATGAMGAAGRGLVTNVRDFNIGKSDLNLAQPLSVYLGDQVIFGNAFLTTFNESLSTEGKTLSVELSDGAILLDRIFVGILHEHVDGSLYYKHIDGKKGQAARYQPGVSGHPYNIEIEARCPVKVEQETSEGKFLICDHNKIETRTHNVTRYLLSAGESINKPDAFIERADAKNIWHGGYIGVGKEEFTEQSCALKDVSYTFADLVYGMEQFGIDVDLTRFTTFNLHLRRQYNGSLRDVLQNWANDFGLTMYWDFQAFKPALSIVRNGDSDDIDQKIRNVDQKIRSLSETDPSVVVSDITRGVTLNGTYSQAYSSVFNIGPSAKNSTTKKATQATFVCEPLDTIGTSTGLYNGRSIYDIYNSCGLGKFSKELRDIYNIRKGIGLIKKCTSFGSLQKREAAWSPYFEALGFRHVMPITFGPIRNSRAGKAFIDNFWLMNETLGESLLDQLDMLADLEAAGKKSVEDGIPPNLEIFVAFVDEKLKSYSEQLESEVANSYLGRHYTMRAPFSEIFDDSQCPYQKVTENLTSNPPSEYFAHNELYRSPIAEFIEKLEDLKMSFDDGVYKNELRDAIDDMRSDIMYDCGKSWLKDARATGFFYFNRSSASWGTFDGDVKNLLNPWTLVLDNIFQEGEENISDELKYRSEKLTGRRRKNLVSAYVPNLHELDIDPAWAAESIPRPAPNSFLNEFEKYGAYQALNKGGNTGMKPMIIVVKTEAGRQLPLNRVGDIRMSLVTDAKFRLTKDSKMDERNSAALLRNPIEELNSLKSYCDRKDGIRQAQAKNCKTTCERDLLESLCGDCGEMEEVAKSAHNNYVQADKNGFIKCKAIRLTRINHKKAVLHVKKASDEFLYSDTDEYNKRTQNQAVDIIFPSEAPHDASLIYNRDTTTTDMGMRKVFDGFNSIDSNTVFASPTSSTLKYVTKDISQAILSAYSTDVGVKDGEIPPWIVLDTILDKRQFENIRKLESVSAAEYHSWLKSHLHDKHSDNPKETFTYKIYLGSNNGKFPALGQLKAYLNADHGLASFSIGADEAGLYLDLSFTNNPLKRPELEALFRKVGPMVKDFSWKLATMSTL